MKRRKKTKKERIKTIPTLITFLKEHKDKMVTLKFIDHESDGENQTEIFRGKIMKYNPDYRVLTFKTHGEEMILPIFSKTGYVMGIFPDTGKKYYRPNIGMPEKTSSEKWKNILNAWIEKAGEGHKDFLIK